MNASSPDSPTSHTSTHPHSFPSSTATSPIPMAGIHLPIPDESSLEHNPTKKSHARKQPPGHIPRPRNAFILFRCSLVKQNRVPKAMQKDHTNISRLAGQLWNDMGDEQRKPWKELAERDKELHSRYYPGYRYTPGSDVEKRLIERKQKAQQRSERDASSGDSRGSSRSRSPWAGYTPPLMSPSFVPPRRSSSCPPPGSMPVSASTTTIGTAHPYNVYAYDGYYNRVPMLTVARDDLGRRPSTTTMYQSVSPMYPTFAEVQSPQYTYPWAETRATHDNMPFNAGAFRMAPPGDAPGWDAAAPVPRDYGMRMGNNGNLFSDPFADINYTDKSFTNITDGSSAWELGYPPSTSPSDLSPPFIDPFSTPPVSASTPTTTPGAIFDSSSSTSSVLPAEPISPLDIRSFAAHPGYHNRSLYPSHLLESPSTRGNIYDLGNAFPRLSLDDTRNGLPRSTSDDVPLYPPHLEGRFVSIEDSRKVEERYLPPSLPSPSSEGGFDDNGEGADEEGGGRGGDDVQGSRSSEVGRGRTSDVHAVAGRGRHE